MKFLNNAIDRFCYKHPQFGIPNLMLYIVIGNALVYVMNMVSQYAFSPMIDFNRAAIFSGQIWRIITFIFVPTNSSLIWMAIGLYFYWFIGSQLEREWGSGKFTIYYFSGVLFTIICGLITGAADVTYVNLSLFLAFATLYPDLQFLLIIIPVKAKWLAWFDAALLALNFVRYLIAGRYALAILIIVSLLNYFIFFYDELMYYVRRTQRSNSRQAMNFKKAAAKKRDAKGYLHKCAVCGKTDTDYPDLEFRYCSKCNGYYCYCMEHINNHIHIVE